MVGVVPHHVEGCAGGVQPLRHGGHLPHREPGVQVTRQVEGDLHGVPIDDHVMPCGESRYQCVMGFYDLMKEEKIGFEWLKSNFLRNFINRHEIS